MTRVLKFYLFTGIFTLLSLVGLWYYLEHNYFQLRQAENAVVLLEKIKLVTKVISVEGQFSELYDYKESYDYDFFNLFSKKILLRVTAKVSVGYDFDKINISVDSISKTITLNEMPHAEILAVDHNLDYYDITQGTFNKFTTDEYNMINRKAKDFIMTKAKTDGLLEIAEHQREKYFSILKMAAQSSGWTLVIKEYKSLLD